MELPLKGSDWKANYFRAARPLADGEFEINNLLMPDGLAAGAHLATYDDSGWFATNLPVDVRDILFSHGLLPDPYIGRHSDATAWPTQFEWWFRKNIQLPSDIAGKRVRLIFKGVDLFADYYLNGQHLGASHDMFVPQVFEITDLVKPDESSLLAVRLLPQPPSSANHWFSGNIPERARYHKAQVSWGWDWSREMMTMGIWDDIVLEVADTVFIDDLWVDARPVDEAQARCALHLELDAKESLMAQMEVAICADGGETIFTSTSPVLLKSGKSTLYHNFSLAQVKFWYPNGYGEQPLYIVRITLRDTDRLLAEKTVTFGIRDVSMQRNDDAPEEAYPLTFCVNGEKIFALGANWVPADLLFARLSRERYEPLVRQAAQMGMNLLRVWGGGLVEKDEFYACCDRYGILVWQEFPLACANYPKDDAYVNEKRIEADAVIRKLRNHPSIALYCGGNELFYYGETSASPVLQMFSEQVAALHPSVAYHYSSPDREREGERDHGPWTYQPQHHHFWNEHFRHFASELGCNACMSRESLQRFLSEQDISSRSQSLRHHFINLEEFESSHSYGGVKLFTCADDDEVIFASQFVQADMLAYIVGKYRSCAWRSSGVLFWQFNSSWPEGMWSVIDYYGVPKLACAVLPEVYAPTAIHLEDDDWELHGAQELSVVFHLLELRPRYAGQKVPVRIKVFADGTLPVHSRVIEAESGEQLAVALDEMALPEDATFFRLQISLDSPDITMVPRNQFYAIDTWKRVCLVDLQAAVSMVYGTSELAASALG